MVPNWLRLLPMFTRMPPNTVASEYSSYSDQRPRRNVAQPHSFSQMDFREAVEAVHNDRNLEEEIDSLTSMSPVAIKRTMVDLMRKVQNLKAKSSLASYSLHLSYHTSLCTCHV